MKNKNWLKEQLSYLQEGVGESFNDYSKGLNAAYNTIGLLINELEEPEQEKVVIPRFVADWIEEERNSDASYVGIRLRFHNFELPEKINNYMNENYETFARAWLDGYSVEKEKLYKVELPIDQLNHILTIHADGSGHFFGKEHTNNSWYRTHLTEQEIKAIDKRFWTFAEEVTE